MDLYAIGIGLICIWSVAETCYRYPPFVTTGAATVGASVGVLSILKGFGL